MLWLYGKDGFEICTYIRNKKLTFPIIMLTAKISDKDKITGLTLGADDYITKPFNPLELVARVKSALRRYTKYNEKNEEEKIYIRLPKDKFSLEDKVIECIKNMSYENKGTTPTYLFYDGTKKVKLLNRELWLNSSDDTLDKLSTYFGSENVKIK